MSKIDKAAEHAWTASWNLQESAKDKHSIEAKIKYINTAQLESRRALNQLMKARGTQEIPHKEPEHIPVKKMPRIKRVPGVKVVNRGPFDTQDGLPKGMIIHFTAGQSIEGTNKDAKGTLNWLAESRLGAVVIDQDGTSYVAENFDLGKWTSHGGSGKWKGQTNCSDLLLGLEVVNPGRLNSSGMSWFKKYFTGYKYWTKKDNIAAGNYLPYTKEQIDEIYRWDYFLTQQADEYDTNWVIGHDEHSPGRKDDPGGALTMTMPEFRKTLEANR